MLTTPNMAISNAMACRVFREIRFGRLPSSGTTLRTTQGFTGPLVVTHSSHNNFPNGSLARDSYNAYESNLTPEHGGITITTATVHASDIPMTVVLPSDEDLYAEEETSKKGALPQGPSAGKHFWLGACQ